MTYRKYFTYGNKTTSEINLLTNIKEGESVWNSDLGKPEYVVNDGGTLLWTNEDCVIMINGSGTTMQEGHLVRMSLTQNVSGAYCTLSTNITGSREQALLCGFVFRGGANGSKVVVAQQGLYNVLYVTTAGQVATRGNLVKFSSTAGRVTQIAPTTGSTTIGVMGVCFNTLTNAQLIANNYLVKAFIQGYMSN